MPPLLSIIVAVYNDWAALDLCLQSLLEQTDGPKFEVVVVDDGSSESAPEAIREWARHFALTLVLQSHSGISAARNHGIRISKGSTLLFVDADSRVQRDCLAALESVVDHSPQHSYFQLRLTGVGTSLVGRAEDLRLTTLQHRMHRADGCIRYLNTAGFAIRKSAAEVETGLFNPDARRAEDTLLLASLVERDELPFFVGDAVIQHDVKLSLLESFRKSIRSAVLEGATYDVIASRGVKVRMTNRERLDMLRSAWEISKRPSIGRSAWFVLLIRQSLQRFTTWIYPLLRSRAVPPPTTPNPSSMTRL